MTSFTIAPSAGAGYSAGLDAWSYPVGTPAPMSAPVAPVAAPVLAPPIVGAATAGMTAPAAAVPGAGGVGGMLKSTFLNEGGGLNLDSLGSVAQGIGALGTLWSGFQANKIAKDALSFQKKTYGTNLANQLASYNLALEDRVRARASGTTMTDEEAQAYLDKHKLKG